MEQYQCVTLTSVSLIISIRNSPSRIKKTALKCCKYRAVSARNFNKFKFNRLYLFEERDCFISGEQDVGCVKDLQMNITLSYTAPFNKITWLYCDRTKTLHRRSTTRHIGQKWFSTIDERKVYQQRFMYPDGRHLTAFVNLSGLYEWICIQTRLKNTPGKFQRSMEEDRLRNFRDDFFEPYLDDIIVYSKSFKELVEHVRQVLRWLLTNQCYQY